MGDVGFQQNFVDTQNVRLSNLNTSTTYIQITDLIMDIDYSMSHHQLTNDEAENVYSLIKGSVYGHMVVTTTEWTDLISLVTDVNGIRQNDIWTVEWIDQSDNEKTTAFDATLSTLRMIDSGIGAVKVFFRLDITRIIGIT